MTKKTANPQEEIARTSREKAGENKTKTPWNKKRYVKLAVDHDGREAVAELVSDPLRVMMGLQEMIWAGYGLKLTYDDQLGGVGVTVDGDSTRANKGRILESTAHNAETALAVAVYKVVYMCDFGSWEREETKEVWFN